MTIATTKRILLKEYLTYDDGTDNCYELVDGELVPISLATGEHGDLSEFLHAEFKAEIQRVGLDWVSKDMKIGIQSPSEYAVLDIPEYWIVDPIDLKVTVCLLKDGAYNDLVFVGDLAIVSPTFPELGLTAIEVLSTGR
jgi:Uma2 family endonuclease